VFQATSGPAGWLPSEGRRRGDGGGAFGQFAAVEDGASPDEGDQMWVDDGAPAGLAQIFRGMSLVAVCR